MQGVPGLEPEALGLVSGGLAGRGAEAEAEAEAVYASSAPRHLCLGILNLSSQVPLLFP